MKVEKIFFTFKKTFYKNFTYVFLISVFSIILINNFLLSQHTIQNLSNNDLKFDKNLYNTSNFYSEESFIVNFPNPFSDLTYIYVRLPKKDDCVIKIYNLFGNLIKEFNLSGEDKYILVWDGRNFNSEKVSRGGYICVLQYNGKKIIRKIGYLR
ncbi:MAG: T9SS type A sorting domain-containing protein [Endomicrobiia bacterium]